MASAPSRGSPSVGLAAGEGGGSSGDGGGGSSTTKGFRLFGAWIQGRPGDNAANHGGDGGQDQVHREEKEQGESSHHGHPARPGRGHARRPKLPATPWTVEEHRSFLRGLEEKGKGKWTAIAKEFVKTRNVVQVASHAQKYFLNQQKAAAGIKPRGSLISIFDVALEAEEDGSVEVLQPSPVTDPSPAPSPAPETPHRGPSSASASSSQQTPSPREVLAPPPQHARPLPLGVAVRPFPAPMPHLVPPHAAVSAAYLPCQRVKFQYPWPWPAAAWAPVWPAGPYFAAAHGQLQQHHHHHHLQQQLASVDASSPISQQHSEEDGTSHSTAA